MKTGEHDRDAASQRLMSAGLWLPVILVPVAYVLLSYFGEDSQHRHGIMRFVFFILPFVLLFVAHHFLLVRPFFYHNRFRLYIAGTVVLLTVFTVAQNLRLKTQRQARRPRVEIPPPPSGQHPGEAPAMRPKPRPDMPRGPKGNRGGPSPLGLDFAIALLLIGANLSAAWYRKYISERERNIELNRSRLQDELTRLKAQLNPHFFMNMLNNIHGMIEVDPTGAQQMVIELSRLMRYLLYESPGEYIPLSDEVRFVDTYVSLMRRRYPDTKVSISLTLPDADSVRGIEVAPLLFMVPVENAFKHGISYLHHSSLDIRLDVGDGNVTLHVTNTRAPRDTGHRDGIGLKNLRKRLSLLYGQAYTLVTDDSDPDLYSVTLKIPYRNETYTLPGH